MDKIHKLCHQISQDKAQLVERCLIGSIEAIEDRAPTFEEVATYMARFVSPKVESWTWKEREIVRVVYWPKRGQPFVVLSLVNPFEGMED